jgi:glucose dehydrogenase
MHMSQRSRQLVLAFGTAAALSAAAIAQTAQSAQNGWATYGNDPGHQRFSTLTQITPENVARLSKAWEFDTGFPAASGRTRRS